MDQEAVIGNDRSVGKKVTTIYPPMPLARGRGGGSESARTFPAQEPPAYNPQMLARVERVVVACLRLMVSFRPLALPPVPLSLSLTHSHALSLTHTNTRMSE